MMEDFLIWPGLRLENAKDILRGFLIVIPAWKHNKHGERTAASSRGISKKKKSKAVPV
jgi:hypothetical protein